MDRVSDCAFCNGTGCPVCVGAWPNPEDRRMVCKGCGKRRERPVAHHTHGMLCGPWVGVANGNVVSYASGHRADPPADRED